MRRSKPPSERVLARIRVTERGCWVFTGALNKEGYGVVGRGRRGEGTMLAHVAVFEAVNGPVPEGMEVDHTCLVHACCNPAHLEPVTHAENMRRAWAAGLLTMPPGSAINAAKTHCPKGHPYDETNTYRISRERRCRACMRARDAGRPRRGSTA